MPHPACPAIVLDTNVVLDWLVYSDPSCEALGLAIERGEVRWLASQGLLDEWNEILRRGVGASRSPDLTALAGNWRRYAVMIEAPPVLCGARRPRCICSDPDDQQFIDLALHNGASWLLSRDRAVLKLAAEARQFGLQIMAPRQWSPAAQVQSTNVTSP